MLYPALMCCEVLGGQAANRAILPDFAECASPDYFGFPTKASPHLAASTKCI
jgi:hypothetical protein